MKNLLLLRHAKSDWGVFFETDHDRPLSPRGRSAARLIGSYLASTGPLPDLILTSSALRARTTAEKAKESGSWPSSIVYSRDLYEAAPESILHLLQQQEDSIGTLMIVGHNPTCESLAHLLIGGGSLRFPTGALARIKFPATAWHGIAFGQGTLSWLVTPKQLKKML
ncbi:MAG: SixA phosphatase family protein [bacterium]